MPDFEEHMVDYIKDFIRKHKPVTRDQIWNNVPYSYETIDQILPKLVDIGFIRQQDGRYSINPLTDANGNPRPARTPVQIVQHYIDEYTARLNEPAEWVKDFARRDALIMRIRLLETLKSDFQLEYGDISTSE